MHVKPDSEEPRREFAPFSLHQGTESHLAVVSGKNNILIFFKSSKKKKPISSHLTINVHILLNYTVLG